MKTVYQKPNTKVVKIHIQHIMAVSNGEGSVVNSVSTKGDYQEGGMVLSRRGGSLWDDEE